MISFELSEEQKIVQSTIQEFAKNVLRPESRKTDDAAQLTDELLTALWSTGVVQSQLDEEQGGSSVTNAIVLEELGFADAAMAVTLAASLGFARAIASQGSPAQRELLGRFANGDFKQGAVALSEPGAGADLLKPSTKARRSGDGYVLQGVKSMVPMAARCSHFLVIADNEGALDAFIVPADAVGVSVQDSHGTLGLKAARMGQVTFDNVTIPAAMRLGEGNGADIQKLVDSARVGLSAIMTGVSRAVMEYVIPYTKDRVVHGTPLAQKQKIAFDIADMHMWIESMRGMTWHAAWELEARRPATRMAQLAYSYGGQQAMTIADNGVQAMGGHGFVKAHPMEMWYRNARALSVLEGAVGV